MEVNILWWNLKQVDKRQPCVPPVAEAQIKEYWNCAIKMLLVNKLYVVEVSVLSIPYHVTSFELQSPRRSTHGAGGWM